MYITETVSTGKNGKKHKSILLRESYRENGVVKNRTIASLTKCPPEQVEAMKYALKNPDHKSLKNCELTQGKSVGAVYTLYELIKRSGIERCLKPLGDPQKIKLAIWLIIARIIQQGSRLSAVRLHKIHALSSVLEVDSGFTEDHFYQTLHLLDKHQSEIEELLFKYKGKTGSFFWYDLTSSYFEGEHNTFASFGYSRDKKKRKKQVVVGLLTQNSGDPISIDAYKGNTQDSETLEHQISKLKNRFGISEFTLVGDRGAIRKKQIDIIVTNNCSYVTGLSTLEIKSRLEKGILEIDDFEKDLKSIIDSNGQRLIYRRNPERAKETRNARNERLNELQKKIDLKNDYLRGSQKRSSEAALRQVIAKVKNLCIDEWVSVKENDRTLYLEIDEDALAEKEKLDGCYVWVTNLPQDKFSDREVYCKYKDLKYVESAFRRLKTTFLEIRPIYVQTKESTCGHLLVSMLAYQVIRELEKAWSQFDLTVEEGISLLSTLSLMKIDFGGVTSINTIPKPSGEISNLLNAINITLPTKIKESEPNVVTRKKLRKEVLQS